MNRARYLPALFASLLLAGCPSEPAAPDPPASSSSPPASQPAETPAPVASPTTEGDVYSVACGCTLAEVGHCGEYAQVEGRFVQIEGDLGLGSMPFCGKSSLRAKITGTVEGDKLRVTSLELVE